jgi:hypothetical protein
MTNGFRSWAETHHEVVTIVNYYLEKEFIPRLLDEIISTEGTGGIYDLCFELTNEFEKIHEGKVWDGDWLDAVIEFIQEKIS